LNSAKNIQVFFTWLMNLSHHKLASGGRLATIAGQTTRVKDRTRDREI